MIIIITTEFQKQYVIGAGITLSLCIVCFFVMGWALGTPLYTIEIQRTIVVGFFSFGVVVFPIATIGLLIYQLKENKK